MSSAPSGIWRLFPSFVLCPRSSRPSRPSSFSLAVTPLRDRCCSRSADGRWPTPRARRRGAAAPAAASPCGAPPSAGRGVRSGGTSGRSAPGLDGDLLLVRDEDALAARCGRASASSTPRDLRVSSVMEAETPVPRDGPGAPRGGGRRCPPAPGGGGESATATISATRSRVRGIGPAALAVLRPRRCPSRRPALIRRCPAALSRRRGRAPREPPVQAASPRRARRAGRAAVTPSGLDDPWACPYPLVASDRRPGALPRSTVTADLPASAGRRPRRP